MKIIKKEQRDESSGRKKETANGDGS
jgi:hypothetical protein